MQILNTIKSMVLVMLLLGSVSVYAGGSDSVAKWDTYPVRMTIGHGELPDQGGDSIMPRNQLLNAMSDWNNLRPQDYLEISPGCTFVDGLNGVPGCPVSGPPNTSAIRNGKNEITLNHWLNNIGLGVEAAAAIRRMSAQNTVSTPGFGQVPKLLEVDIYVNVENFVFYTGSRPAGCAIIFSNAIEVLKHEAGHAIGLGHLNIIGKADHIMTRQNGGCDPHTSITQRDIGHFNNVFFNQTVNVSILEPRNGNVLPAGRNRLLADVADNTGFGSSFGAGFGAGGSLTPVWESSIDGELGSGADIQGFLRPGEHLLTASVIDPQTNETVTSLVRVSVISDTQELANLSPLPCIRLAGDPDGRCLLHYSLDFLLNPTLACTGYQSAFFSIDEQTGEAFEIALQESNLDCSQDILSSDAYTWLYADDSRIDQYRFTEQLSRFGSLTNIVNRVGTVSIANTNIRVNTDALICDLSDGASHCSVDIDWRDHFLDVGTGLYKKTLPNNEWQLVAAVQGESGTLSVTLAATELPAELAVFQYRENFGVIEAPAGLLHGPVAVEVIYGTPAGSLSSDAPCSLSSTPGGNCTVQVTGSKTNTLWACTWIGSGSGLAATECWNTANFAFAWPHANSNCCLLTLKAHSSRPFDEPGYAIGSTVAQAIYSAAPTLATESAFGQSTQITGTLTSDSPCTLASGATTCTVIISSTHINTPIACLWRTTSGLSVALVGCGSSQRDYSWPHAQVGSSDSFELRAHASTPPNNASGYTAGVLLDTLNTTAQAPQGNNASGILNSDSPCTVAIGATTCTVTTSSTHTNTPVSCLWRTTSGLPISYVGCGNVDRDYAWPHARVESSDSFELRAHVSTPPNDANGYAGGVLLDTLNTTAQEPQGNNPNGTLSSDSPCTVATGATTCTVTISSSHANTPVSCLWRTTSDLPVALVGCDSSQRDYSWPHARIGSRDNFELLAHLNTPPNTASGYAGGILLDTLSTTAQ